MNRAGQFLVASVYGNGRKWKIQVLLLWAQGGWRLRCLSLLFLSVVLTLS